VRLPFDRIRAEGAAEWLGNRYPYHYLSRLLGDSHTLPEQQRRYSLLLLRAGTQRVSVQVDQLRGNQEVVVKNIGPQLARVIGIAGATVLGDGEVVLILNPIALASREIKALAHEIEAPSVPAVEAAAPRLPTVMIVDDSLTVRKITGRLLSREGSHVLAAKDGVDALEQLLDSVPDVMLVDIEMPRMDGFDLTRNVRADARLSTWYSGLVTTALFCVASVVLQHFVPPVGLVGWIWVLLIGITTTTGVAVLFVSTTRIGPFLTALTMNLEPLLATVLSALFLGELFTPVQALGAAVMIASLFAFQLRR